MDLCITCDNDGGFYEKYDDNVNKSSFIDCFQKEDGYCKIYYSVHNDFYWKKCKIKRQNIDYTKLTCVDYKSKPRILNKNEDVLLAYDI